MIVTKSGDTLIGHIVYESPKHFRIKHLSGATKDNHGTAARISCDQVIYVKDNLPAYQLQKFGKIKIYSIHSDKYIHKPFYSANDSSITYISSSENLREEGWIYRTYDIPIADIEKVRWHYSSAGGGIIIGGILGAIIGGVIGGSAVDKPTTINGVFTYGAEATGGAALGSLIGAVAGAILGGSIQAAATNKSTKLELHGDQQIWEQQKHQLPPINGKVLFID